jgi:hypothetical protein
MFRAFFLAVMVLTSVWAVAPTVSLAVEETPGEAAAVTTIRPGTTGLEEAPSETRWYGFLELRPSYGSRVGEWHTEDTVEAGYYFNKNDRLFYSQWLLSNLYQPTAVNDGDGIRADDGALRLRLENIWTSGDTRLSYRNRVYTPTRKTKRDVGFMTSIRNDLVLIQKMSDVVSMDFSIIPTLHFYDRAGANGAAHPMFAQMFILNADFSLTEKLKFSLPLIYEVSRYRNFQANATRNDSWGNNLWIWPELAYGIDATHTVGLSYYSANVLTDNGTLQVANGLENGVYQLLWGINL